MAKGKGKSKSAATLVNQLAKEHEHILITRGSGVEIQLKGVIPTGLPTLDHAIGRGGIPLGRLTVLTGQESVGKTTLALQLAARTQEMGGVAVFIDREHKLDPPYAAALGVNLDDLIVAKPDHLEDCFTTMEHAAALVQKKRGDVPVLIILDSINAAISKAEYEAEYDTVAIAGSARVFAYAMPRIMGRLARVPVALVWLSQYRMKITSFGSYNERFSGGNAVKFYAALGIDMKRVDDLKIGPRIVGADVKTRVIKNQVAPPFRETVLQVRHMVGFDRDASLLERARQLGFVNESQMKWFEMPDPEQDGKMIRWQGIEGANGWTRLVTEKRPGLREYLYAAVRAKEGWA